MQDAAVRSPFRRVFAKHRLVLPLIFHNAAAAQNQFETTIIELVQTDAPCPRAILQRKKRASFANVFQRHGAARWAYARNHMTVLDIETGAIG